MAKIERLRHTQDRQRNPGDMAIVLLPIAKQQYAKQHQSRQIAADDRTGHTPSPYRNCVAGDGAWKRATSSNQQSTPRGRQAGSGGGIDPAAVRHR